MRPLGFAGVGNGCSATLRRNVHSILILKTNGCSLGRQEGHSWRRICGQKLKGCIGLHNESPFMRFFQKGAKKRKVVVIYELLYRENDKLEDAYVRFDSPSELLNPVQTIM